MQTKSGVQVRFEVGANSKADNETAFHPCCGQPPKVTEWRPGCYGAQCMCCGVIMGDERQLDEDELRDAWNRAMRKRAIAKLAVG
jgi:hypothetical protein